MAEAGADRAPLLPPADDAPRGSRVARVASVATILATCAFLAGASLGGFASHLPAARLGDARANHPANSCAPASDFRATSCAAIFGPGAAATEKTVEAFAACAQGGADSSQRGSDAAHLAPRGVLPQAAPRERAGRQERKLK